MSTRTRAALGSCPVRTRTREIRVDRPTVSRAPRRFPVTCRFRHRRAQSIYKTRAAGMRQQCTIRAAGRGWRWSIAGVRGGCRSTTTRRVINTVRIPSVSRCRMKSIAACRRTCSLCCGMYAPTSGIRCRLRCSNALRRRGSVRRRVFASLKKMLRGGCRRMRIFRCRWA